MSEVCRDWYLMCQECVDVYQRCVRGVRMCQKCMITLVCDVSGVCGPMSYICHVCQVFQHVSGIGYRMLQTSDVLEISLCQRFVAYIRGVSGAPRNKNDKHVSNRMNRSDFLTAA